MLAPIFLGFTGFSGCVSSTPAPPAVVEDGKPIWQRVETQHFTVEDNLESDSETKRIASEFETLWTAFASVPILGLRPPHEKPVVVVLRRNSEFSYIVGDNYSGQFIPGTVLGPLILLPPNAGAFGEIAVKHELSHFIASDSLKDAPEWLHEGLAEVMQTAKYDAQKGKILFGQFSPELVFAASVKVPAEKFMAPWPENLTLVQKGRYYGRSWLLVHYLIDDELQQFLNFLVRIRRGEKWKSAWDQEILVRLGELDETLDRYHERAKYGLWSVDAYLPDMSPLQCSTVPPADALALRAVLQAYALNPARTDAQKQQAVAADLDAANKIDPSSARVRAISAALAKSAHE